MCFVKKHFKKTVIKNNYLMQHQGLLVRNYCEQKNNYE